MAHVGFDGLMLWCFGAQKVMKEKSVLAERLKGAEGGRKRLTTEALTREEGRAALEVEMQRLTKSKGQSEQGLRDKEEQVRKQQKAQKASLCLPHTF